MREMRCMAIEGTAEVERARSDAAIAAFVAEHYDRLLRLARLVCRDAGDAADAVQVGLEQAWRRRSTLRDDALLRPWLDRIVVREAARISKRRQSWLSPAVYSEARGRVDRAGRPARLRAVDVPGTAHRLPAASA